MGLTILRIEICKRTAHTFLRHHGDKVMFCTYPTALAHAKNSRQHPEQSTKTEVTPTCGQMTGEVRSALSRTVSKPMQKGERLERKGGTMSKFLPNHRTIPRINQKRPKRETGCRGQGYCGETYQIRCRHLCQADLQLLSLSFRPGKISMTLCGHIRKGRTQLPL